MKNVLELIRPAVMSYYAWYHGLLTTYLLLTKSLNVPLPALNSSWQHCGYLVDHESSPGHESKASHHPESTPFDPLTQIVWEEDYPKKAVLWYPVYLLHPLSLIFPPLGFFLSILVSCSCSPDLTKLVVMEHVP